MKWEFKTIDSLGRIVSLDKKGKVGLYSKMLEEACTSEIPKPKFSNFFVKNSIGINNKIEKGGNIEYGCCQALHAEETTVALWKSLGIEAEPVMAFVVSKEGQYARPCGNCRDIMRDNLGNDFELIGGASSGGVAIVLPMKQYIFDNYAEGNLPKGFQNKLRKVVVKGAELVYDPYSPDDVNPERKYTAMIITKKKNYVGAISLRCEYHPIYAIEDAVRQAERANDCLVKNVIVACNGNVPDVMYRDRQHLFELNLDAEILENKLNDPEVYLVNYSLQGKRVVADEVMVTSVKEWLPMPFSPRNFGEEFMKKVLKPYVLQRYK